jgi:hypothetical protein
VQHIEQRPQAQHVRQPQQSRCLLCHLLLHITLLLR